MRVCDKCGKSIPVNLPAIHIAVAQGSVHDYQTIKADVRLDLCDGCQTKLKDFTVLTHDIRTLVLDCIQ